MTLISLLQAAEHTVVVFLESDETSQRSVFIEAIGNSSLQRIIWTSPFAPSEELTDMKNLIYIICRDKQAST